MKTSIESLMPLVLEDFGSGTGCDYISDCNLHLVRKHLISLVFLYSLKKQVFNDPLGFIAIAPLASDGPSWRKRTLQQ